MMNEVAKNNSTYKSKIPFYLLILFLAFEYGRIHSLLGPLKFLHFPFFTSLGLLLFLIIDKPVLNHLQTKCFLGLIILMMIHIPFAANNYWAFQITRTMFTYLVIHIAITKYVVSYKMFRKMMFLWLMCGIFLCIQGVFHGGVIKGSAFFSDENDFSLAMNMFLGMSYFRFLENPKKNKSMLVMIGLFILGILASFSRGGFVGLCVVLFVIWIKSRKKVLGLLLAASLVLFILLIAPSKYWDEMKTIPEVEEGRGTSATRIYYWERAWMMFVDHPLFGVGPGNYPWNIIEYEPEGGYRGKRHGGRMSHSLYFTLIPELGLAGCLFFGMMVFANYKTLRGMTKQFGRNKRRNLLYEGIGKKENNTLRPINSEISQIKNMMYYDALGIYVAMAGFLASGAFLSVLYYPHFWILSGMITSMGRLKEELQNEELASIKKDLVF